MTEIDVPDWVVEAALLATSDPSETSLTHAEYARAIITAALGAWLGPAPALHISERCETCGDVLHASVSATNHITLRQEKPE